MSVRLQVLLGLTVPIPVAFFIVADHLPGKQISATHVAHPIQMIHATGLLVAAEIYLVLEVIGRVADFGGQSKLKRIIQNIELKDIHVLGNQGKVNLVHAPCYENVFRHDRDLLMIFKLLVKNLKYM